MEPWFWILMRERFMLFVVENARVQNGLKFGDDKHISLLFNVNFHCVLVRKLP